MASHDDYSPTISRKKRQAIYPCHPPKSHLCASQSMLNTRYNDRCGYIFIYLIQGCGCGSGCLNDCKGNNS